ncbi:MAG TPA: transcription termination factor NusA [Actinomycetota bacterium]|nr:transcription termination factor NusA [Actinomycetota bacterium]
MKGEDLVQALRELEREKGISFETILRGLEEALASAYKSAMHLPEEEAETEDVRVMLDPATGEMRAFLRELDEDGTVTSEKEVELTADFTGRIAAQTAKQVILQKLRDAEREITYEEFAGREGDVVTGIVQQDSHRYAILDLGKVEALLPFQEKTPSESYRHGERLKAYIVEVRRTSKGPQIVVSRTHPELLKKLFEMEVPEIADGMVEIKAVAREPGHRSKIAVVSHEPGVDPVGACVGAKGSRVRMVVNELRGEKIDVVEWSDDASRFVAKALAPASVKEVRIDRDTQTALVIVPDYQLSLAIGKEGQNARLAARLTGWRIDIKSESQFAEEASAPTGRASAPPSATRGVASGEASAPTAEAEASAEGTPLVTEAEADAREAGADGRGAGEADATSAQGAGMAAGEPSPETLAAAPEGERQCRAVLASGERCTNPAKPGSDYCGIPAHQKQAEAQAPATEGTQA